MDRSRHPVNVAMLKDIMALRFSLLETVLYLNTHPFDQVVLELHNDFSRRLMHLVDQYQQRYGPLMPGHPDPTVPWSWIDEPWPWQIEY